MHEIDSNEIEKNKSTTASFSLLLQAALLYKISKESELSNDE